MNCKTFALIGIILVGVALHNAVGQSFEAPQDVDKAEEVRPVVYSRTSRGIGKLFKNLFRGKKGEVSCSVHWTLFSKTILMC